jgi:hypothetical protein
MTDGVVSLAFAAVRKAALVSVVVTLRGGRILVDA